LSVVGVDLAGVEHRPSGFCVLTHMKVETCLLHTDAEIIMWVTKSKPRVVAIDAPLSLPPGRKNIEDRGEHFRECDRELLRRRIKFFPVTLGPMRKLTERGIRLKTLLEKNSFIVIEVYPGGAQDVLRIPRKGSGLNFLENGLKRLGIRGISHCTDHELDAITCAYVGKLFLAGETIPYGSGDQIIIMPSGPAMRDLP
jgi:predicted nuclease with RNAse H fold